MSSEQNAYQISNKKYWFICYHWQRVGVGRESIVDPQWVNKIIDEDPIEWLCAFTSRNRQYSAVLVSYYEVDKSIYDSHRGDLG